MASQVTTTSGHNRKKLNTDKPKAAKDVSSNVTSAAASVSELLGTIKSCPPDIVKSTLIAIGASTGGTESTLEVLRTLPEQMPPIVIVQHMPPGFTKLYAERLNKICSIKIKEAEDGETIKPGHAYIAPGGTQMRLLNLAGMYKLKCQGSELVSGHCPSVDALFKSVAEVSKLKNIGIILTGMGKDGAVGLLEMKKKGAYTFGESPESCVVYGMPMEAYNIGAVCVQASNKEIPALLMKHLNSL